MARQLGIFFGGLLVVILIAAVFAYRMYHSTTSVVVNGQTFTMEIANTDALRTKGLSGHAPLAPNHGMLFVFPQLGNYGFWMKDMLFSLDIIWVNDRFQITHIEQSVSPSTYPTMFYPDALSLYVLEVPAGTASLLNIHVGDNIQLN